jgi:hypothetical protein
MYQIIGGDQKEYGPVAAEEVREWIKQRRLNASSLVRSENATDWRPLSAFPEFSSTLASMTPAAAVTAQTFVPAPRNNPMAIAGLVCGIMAWPATCCCYGVPFNVLGIVFSAIALNQLRRDQGGQGGRAMAIVGLALSIMQIVLIIGFVALGVAFSWSDIMRDLKR